MASSEDHNVSNDKTDEIVEVNQMTADVDDAVVSASKKRKKSFATMSSRTPAYLEKNHTGVFIKSSDEKQEKPLVICSVCNTSVNISAVTKDATAHIKTSKHQSAVRARRGQQDLFASRYQPIDIPDSTTNAEMLLSQFIATSNISFATSTNLVQ